MSKEKRQPPAAYKEDSALGDKERAELEALDIGTGAAFNRIITENVAFLNSEGWQEKKRDAATGVVWEWRRSACSDKEAARFTMRVPGANAGALQALLLDDPDFTDDPKVSSIYQWDDLIQRNHADRWLARNVYVCRTQFKSPVWGIAPREMAVYLTLGALLGPEQQRALGLPNDTSGCAFMQCGIEYTGDAGAAAEAKGHQRGHTHHYLHLAQEVPSSGELVYTYVIDADPAGSLPSRMANIANDAQFKKAKTLFKKLKEKGKKENVVKEFYTNTRDYNPLAK